MAFCELTNKTSPAILLPSQMNGRGIVQDLTSAMADVSLEQLSLGCNRDFRPLHRSLTQMIGVMDALNQASNRVFDILRCDRIVPIYKSIVYDGTCKHSIKGLTWIFSALFVISLMGMIMIMFRSSFQNTVFEAQTKEMDNESSIVVHHRTTPASKKKAEEATAERWDDEDVDDNMEQSQLLKKDRAKRR